jgi:hypothetical protein
MSSALAVRTADNSPNARNTVDLFITNLRPET